MSVTPLNIPNPDPSVIANERLAEALLLVNGRMERNREEARGWIDSLQVLLEEKIMGGLENIKTRLDGNDTALVAALKAQKEEAAKQTENFKEVLGESKKGTEKQIDSLNEKIEDLKKRVFESGGKSEGISNTVVMIISLIAAAAAIGVFTIQLMKAPAPLFQPTISHRILHTFGVNSNATLASSDETRPSTAVDLPSSDVALPMRDVMAVLRVEMATSRAVRR